MDRKLVHGDMYRATDGSIVEYHGKVDCERSHVGWCYKFVTMRSKTKYILPEELDAYLGEQK